jgi:hypothetical protein
MIPSAWSQLSLLQVFTVGLFSIQFFVAINVNLATLFHGALLLGVVLGNQTTGTFDGSLRGFLTGDCCYFVCVLLASITELVSLISAERDMAEIMI